MSGDDQHWKSVAFFPMAFNRGILAQGCRFHDLLFQILKLGKTHLEGLFTTSLTGGSPVMNTVSTQCLVDSREVYKGNLTHGSQE